MGVQSSQAWVELRAGPHYGLGWPPSVALDRGGEGGGDTTREGLTGPPFCVGRACLQGQGLLAQASHTVGTPWCCPKCVHLQLPSPWPGLEVCEGPMEQREGAPTVPDRRPHRP